MFKRLLVVAVFLAIGLVLPSLARVYADVRIFVYPVKLEMPVSPGGSLTKEITIENRDEESVKIRTYVMDYRIKKNNKFEFSPPGHESYSAARWITLDKADFTIPPRKKEKVNATLKVPTGAEPSGHYVVIFFETVGKLSPGKTGVIPQGRIATLVLQYSPGNIVAKGRVKEFTIPKYFYSRPKSFLFGGEQPIPWSMVFENHGNVHLNIDAQIDFSDFRGKSLHITKPQRITILPNTERELQGRWENAPTFGKFTAILKVTYDKRIETKTANFYVIPVKGLIVTGAGVVLLIFVLGLAYWLGQRRAAGAKVACPKCNGLIDKEAASCPHCGYTFSRAFSRRRNPNR